MKYALKKLVELWSRFTSVLYVRLSNDGIMFLKNQYKIQLLIMFLSFITKLNLFNIHKEV